DCQQVRAKGDGCCRSDTKVDDDKMPIFTASGNRIILLGRNHRISEICIEAKLFRLKGCAGYSDHRPDCSASILWNESKNRSLQRWNLRLNASCDYAQTNQTG